MNDDQIKHYGIIGMKWGVRRFQNKDGSLTSAGRKRYSDDNTDNELSNSMSKKKNISEMTDDELDVAIRRLEREKRYSSLVSELPQKQISTGKRIADKFMSETVVNIATRSAEEIGTQVAKHILSKAVNKIAKEEIVYPNNKKK